MKYKMNTSIWQVIFFSLINGNFQSIATMLIGYSFYCLSRSRTYLLHVLLLDVL